MTEKEKSSKESVARVLAARKHYVSELDTLVEKLKRDPDLNAATIAIIAEVVVVYGPEPLEDLFVAVRSYLDEFYNSPQYIGALKKQLQ